MVYKKFRFSVFYKKRKPEKNRKVHILGLLGFWKTLKIHILDSQSQQKIVAFHFN